MGSLSFISYFTALKDSGRVMLNTALLFYDMRIYFSIITQLLTFISLAFLCSFPVVSFAAVTQSTRVIPPTTAIQSANVPYISDAQLLPHYWLNKVSNGSEVLLTAEQISTRNQQQFSNEPFLTHPLSYANTLTGEQVRSLITKVSKIPSANRYYSKNNALTQSDYQGYIDEMNLPALTAQIKVTFAVVTQRSSLRTFPTLDRVFNEKLNTDIDRFQESAVFPGEALAVLHTSKNQQWVFVQNYHYRAWVQRKDIAFASKKQVQQFIDQPERIVITGARVYTNVNPAHNATSEVALEMGVNLPLITNNTVNTTNVFGQNTYNNYTVLLPTRTAEGYLQLTPTLIAKSADVSIGFLPLTKNNIVQQAFKFLGERYGWGHDFNGRDCTGFIGEIFKSFGLYLPRNSGQQGKSQVGTNHLFNEDTLPNERYRALTNLAIGDLLYLPGHVAMFIGYVNNKPYIIHDVHGMEYINTKGQKVVGVLNGVSVTPLLPFKSYIDTMYNIKRLY